MLVCSAWKVHYLLGSMNLFSRSACYLIKWNLEINIYVSKHTQSSILQLQMVQSEESYTFQPAEWSYKTWLDQTFLQSNTNKFSQERTKISVPNLTIH